MERKQEGTNQKPTEIRSPLEILQQNWGYPAFRPLQKEIIDSVLEGKDTLALMPTGGGKSICFQVPALCKPGICIVVSPLIALMKDQVQQLSRRNIPAVAIYSGMHYRDIDRILDNCIYGNIRFLYLSPERLVTDLARERIAQMKVNLLAVDEAHCISQWGYDFRPPYLQIAEVRKLIPDTPVLALTATATPEVVVDIQEKLEFKSENLFQKSFLRANLSYSVLAEEAKPEKLYEIFHKVKGSGVVYVRSRRKTKETALYLQQRGISADYYHAGLDAAVRSQKQENWMNNKTRVIVSTNAFGMGIDKPDVRVVVHLDLPDSLEAYFQEAGRAGRDGEKSYAVLLYNKADKQRLIRQYELSFPAVDEMRQVYRALSSYFQLASGSGKGESYDFDIGHFCKTFHLEPVKTFHCLKHLEKADWIALSEAIYVPSSIQIKVNKDQLYDYQLKNPKLDKLLKTILRTYQGAFQHPVFIHENRLAQFLKIKPSEVKQQLLHLNKENILKYIPQKDKPQLTFLQERVTADHLSIDQKAYNLRKRRQYDRIQKAIAYVEQPLCRSQQLLAYFGEETSSPCGICDVCLGRTKTSIDETTFTKLKNKIRLLLKRDALQLDAIVESFSPKWQNQVLKTVEYLVDEGFMEQNEEGEFGWKKNGG